MKQFLGVFGMCYILGCLFFFFGGWLVLNNFWSMIFVGALIMTIMISLYMKQEKA